MLQSEPMIVTLEDRRQDRRDSELLALCDRAVDVARHIEGDPELVATALEYCAGLARSGELRRKLP